jgi:hypothetical protein
VCCLSIFGEMSTFEGNQISGEKCFILPGLPAERDSACDCFVFNRISAFPAENRLRTLIAHLQLAVSFQVALSVPRQDSRRATHRDRCPKAATSPIKQLAGFSPSWPSTPRTRKWTHKRYLNLDRKQNNSSEIANGDPPQSPRSRAHLG